MYVCRHVEGYPSPPSGFLRPDGKWGYTRNGGEIGSTVGKLSNTRPPFPSLPLNPSLPRPLTRSPRTPSPPPSPRTPVGSHSHPLALSPPSAHPNLDPSTPHPIAPLHCVGLSSHPPLAPRTLAPLALSPSGPLAHSHSRSLDPSPNASHPRTASPPQLVVPWYPRTLALALYRMPPRTLLFRSCLQTVPPSPPPSIHMNPPHGNKISADRLLFFSSLFHTRSSHSAFCLKAT